MRYDLALEYDDFDGIPERDEMRVLWAQVNALVEFNVAWLRLHPTTPLLYASGVVFQREADGALNIWSNIPAVIRRKRSHCVGLSAWRVAELLVAGEKARPCIQVFHEDRPGYGMVTEFHVTVLHPPDDDHEDPSRLLGMK